jgi:cell division transport system permease protein
MWTNVRRVFTSGAKSFVRTGSVSFATVLVMTVTLLIIGFLVFLSAILSSTLQSIENQVDINIYFTTNATDSDIQTLKDQLSKQPEVASLAYTSADQALSDFRQRHINDQVTLQALDELGGNPLGATLAIKAKDPAQYADIVKFLEGQPAVAAGSAGGVVDHINYYQNKTVIDRLTTAIHATARAGAVIVFLFALASTIIALATIRLAIYSARDEIAVMRLVGASNMYIRGPFIVAGILSGLFASLITLALFFPAAWYVGSATETWLGGFNVFTYYIGNFALFFGVLVGSGVLLGGIASWLAVRRYLKV